MILALLSLLLSPVFSEAAFSDDLSKLAWEKISDRDGIRVFSANVPGSAIPAFRAEGEIDAPVAKVIGVIGDTSRRNEWSPNVEDTRIVRKLSKTEWIEYWHLGTPIIVKDKDLVIKVSVRFDARNKQLVIPFHSVTDEGAPPTDYVRANVLGGAYLVSALPPSEAGGEGRTHFVYQAQIDLGGSAAQWLTSAFQRDYPRRTIEGLRKQVRRKDVSEHPKIRQFFEGKVGSLEEVL
ncbi:MAG: START domain-containing protein [Oligoflexia bacterium]|nr:START domain-containing protein [Oligoflexia bacterium]